MPSPKEIYDQNEVAVDPSKFELKRWLWEVLRNYKSHPYLSPNYYLVRILYMIAVYVLWRIGR